MHIIGWSTGTLLPDGHKTDYSLAIELLNKTPFTCIEFGVLREHELPLFLEQLPDLDVSQFERVSFHACKLEKLSEEELLEKIEPVIERGWPIINHPNMITNYDLWRPLGSQLFVENMENRKKCGRTVKEMQSIFEELPDASMCFDIGHAKQVDPSMELARNLCLRFKDRIREIHFSEVNSACTHVAINHNTLRAFGRMTDVLPQVPVILESAPASCVKDEVEYLMSELPLYGMKLKTKEK